ncbi:MAG: hypothetical protein HY898_16255 [Deltaproteobacteria bacterium]|nr:hypothetical protein [Deltaproteobacteria bacterium]
MRAALLLPACLVLACSAAPAPNAPQPEPVTPPTVSAPPSPATAAPSVAAPPAKDAAPAASASTGAASKPPPGPRKPLPAAPAGADRERFSFAASVCAVAVKHDKGKVQVGCRECPPFESTASQPDGSVAVDPDSFFQLEAVVRGSFTRAGAEQAALVFEGCEPHSSNYGGTLLVEKAADGWNAVHYASAFHPRECKTFRRPDGRDILVCRYLDAHQTTGTDQISSFDFAQASPDDPEKGWDSVLTVSDNSYSACMGTPPWGFSASNVVSYGFRDVNADGKPDLFIQVRRASVSYSKALEDKISKACQQQIKTNPDAMPVVKPSTFLSAPVTVTLEYLFDGTKFVPTAATDKRLKAWKPPGE